MQPICLITSCLGQVTADHEEPDDSVPHDQLTSCQRQVTAHHEEQVIQCRVDMT